MFCPGVATIVQLPVGPVRRKILKPVSLDELSVHVRLTWLEETAMATRFAGAAGGASGIITWAIFEKGDSPPALKAKTRYS